MSAKEEVLPQDGRRQEGVWSRCSGGQADLRENERGSVSGEAVRRVEEQR